MAWARRSSLRNTPYGHGAAYVGVWWWPAETVSDLVSSTVALAKTLGLPEADATDQTQAAEAVRRRLAHERDRWLLIFDNATDPAMLADYSQD